MGCIPSTANYFCLDDNISNDKREFTNISHSSSILSDGSVAENPITPLPNSSHCEIERMARKRALIRNEILSTERNLVKHFEVMDKVIYQPLTAGDIIDASIVKDQFNDYLTIKGIHTCLLSELDRGSASIAAIFDEFAPALKIYKPYLQHFERRLRHRAQLIVTNAAFNRFINSAQDNPLCRGQTVESLLVEPVQRVPRYKLLLMEASTSSC